MDTSSLSHTVLPPPVAQRVAIFIDTNHYYYTARNLFQMKVDYGALLRKLLAGRALVRAVAYVQRNLEIDQSQFWLALSNYGYDVKPLDLKVVAEPGQAKRFITRSCGVSMTIDALTEVKKADTIVLGTGEGDYVPLAEALRLFGCRVEVAGFERATSQELIQTAHAFFPLTPDIMLSMPVERQERPAPTLTAPTKGKILYEGLPQDV